VGVGFGSGSGSGFVRDVDVVLVAVVAGVVDVYVVVDDVIEFEDSLAEVKVAVENVASAEETGLVVYIDFVLVGVPVDKVEDHYYSSEAFHPVLQDVLGIVVLDEGVVKTV